MERRPFDLDSYVRRTRSSEKCFICEMLAGNPDFAHHHVFEDDEAVAFLSKYPTMVGYCIVAPKQHVEDLADGLDEGRYLRLQAVVHRLARAMKRVLPVERIYVLSLGSKQGNSHIHWHVAPLPPGVPYDKQQYYALMAENGVMETDEAEMQVLAARLGAAMTDQASP